ncbi:MAG: ABC transporter ATP-binding protein [Candidatus Zixiibacteriota bacterium]
MVFTLTVTDLTKRFGTRTVFSNLQFDLTTGRSLAAVGPNGSGKTTLLMTLLALYRPTMGSVTLTEDGQPVEESRCRAVTGLVAPYLNLYEQLTAEENLKFFANMSGVNVTGKRIDSLLERVGLAGRGCDPVGEYSSGMKQRLKYALALMKDPALLALDEPGSNLDEQGKQVVRDIVTEYRERCILVIASSEAEEASLADRQLRLGE